MTTRTVQDQLILFYGATRQFWMGPFSIFALFQIFGGPHISSWNIAIAPFCVEKRVPRKKSWKKQKRTCVWECASACRWEREGESKRVRESGSPHFYHSHESPRLWKSAARQNFWDYPFFSPARLHSKYCLTHLKFPRTLAPVDVKTLREWVVVCECVVCAGVRVCGCACVWMQKGTRVRKWVELVRGKHPRAPLGKSR